MSLKPESGIINKWWHNHGGKMLLSNTYKLLKTLKTGWFSQIITDKTCIRNMEHFILKYKIDPFKTNRKQF